MTASQVPDEKTVPPGGASDRARSVGAQVSRGAAWSLLNNVVLRLGTLLSGIVLARLLSPADYGVFAVALVVLALLHAFNELGVSLALVRWERDLQEFAPTVMTIAVTSSTILYALAWFAAPAFCEVMGSPAAVPVLRVLCLAVILDGIATVPSAILDRHFQQLQRFACDLAAFVTMAGLTITLAATGHGAMSFAVGQVAGTIVTVVGYLWLCSVRVTPGWSGRIATELLRFGLPLAGASLLVLSITHAGNIVVGALSDDATLGLYLMAFNVSGWALTVVTEAARRVSLAGFSRLVDDPEQLGKSLARGVGLLMAITVPVCVLVASYAGPGLEVVYGAKWVPAAAALQALAALALLRVLLNIGYDLLVALDGNRILIALNAVWLIALIPVLLIGTAKDGIRGAAVAQLAVAALLMLPIFAMVLRRYPIRWLPTIKACVRPAVGGLAVVISAVVVRMTISGALPQVIIGGLVAIALYLPVVMPMRAMLPGRTQQDKDKGVRPQRRQVPLRFQRQSRQ